MRLTIHYIVFPIAVQAASVTLQYIATSAIGDQIITKAKSKSMLTSIHWNTLHSLMNRIIPQDDFPAAWEAGVGDYLARQFEGDLKSQVEKYQLGLDALEAESRANTGKGFTELDDSKQDEILSRIESGTVVSSWQVNPTEFFHMVITHVMEGYYSDLGNGGNRNSITWQMIGFESRE